MIRKYTKYLSLVLGLFVGSTAFAETVLTVEQNMAKPLEFNEKISELFVSNPDIADVQMNNPKVAYIFGKKPGQTSVIALNEKGKQVVNYRVVVTHNVGQIQTLVEEAAPNDFVEVRSVPGGIVVEGTAETPAVAENIKGIVEQFLGENQIFVNHLGVKAPVQVNLRVKVAEVNRTALNRLGFNWDTLFSDLGNFAFGFNQGRVTNVGGAVIPAQPDKFGGPLSSLASNFSDSKMDINSVIDALSKEQLVTILAEPNLMAVSGETASFLAGGEFPYPVPQDDGTVTIEFKQFGVSLSFAPTVLGDKLISMRVRPEVSELDDSRTVNLAGFPVPGITTRRAETTIELGSGQSFAIAGLLKNTVTSDISGTTGLGDLPVIGTLFRSNKFQRGESELVIVVTPYLVHPVSGKEIALPTDGLNYATFVEQVFDRKLNRTDPHKGAAGPLGGGGSRLVGPAGFAIE